LRAYDACPALRLHDIADIQLKRHSTIPNQPGTFVLEELKEMYSIIALDPMLSHL
jgi:hypothetical protein